jgi:hypothetical protein
MVAIYRRREVINMDKVHGGFRRKHRVGSSYRPSSVISCANLWSTPMILVIAVLTAFLVLNFQV